MDFFLQYVGMNHGLFSWLSPGRNVHKACCV